MKTQALIAGTVHDKVPADLRASILSDEDVVMLWEDITPLARNEWICWVENAKQVETRKRRIEQTNSKLLGGTRRPCCWVGCMHRDRNGS